jgi:hypothetical protein
VIAREKKFVKILDAEFGRRVSAAVDAMPGVPEKNYGRLEWIANRFEQAGGEKLPAETVRRWLAGEARPHRKRMVILAKALDQDVSYLYGGFGGGLPPSETRKVAKTASAYVELVSSLIQLDGGSTSLPQENDEKKSYVHMYAIIKGAMYSIHVALVLTTDGEIKAIVPASFEDCTVLCAIRKTGFAFDVVEITSEAIAKHGARKATGTEVKIVSESGRYAATGVTKGSTDLIKIANFQNRI